MSSASSPFGERGPVLATPRLILRRWRAEDLAPFAALNADAEVMRFFPAPLDRAQSDALATRADALFDAHPFGVWAVERRADGAFLGMVGLNLADFAVPFLPGVEILWRLARNAWGYGYATEAARAAADHGFASAGLSQILAFTYAGNAPSRGVMVRLGMTHDAASDFAHPLLPPDHALSRHVLYRLKPD
ncbi:GNAT family N-acetyltransferase [Zavarzinia sp. CC-PAN008]|uniref:GNAT family N-acetyltransferase n=1 Tax=Zavarzinia sp. CC-PAN008 TaxID=3243332 RepID=UPI003F7454F0